MKRLPVMVLCLGLPMALAAQQDSADFRLEQLSANDVVTPASRAVKVVSTNRTAQDLRDISYSMHVVTKEEILDNGYNTLVDVLKHVPGIKVSQPGSAIDGESFMMRGFYGNYYTKILINSIDDYLVRKVKNLRLIKRQFKTLVF
ncbi:MAG: TonB-dependent receptor plug domain-containing protein [Bacteroidota bacterium]